MSKQLTKRNRQRTFRRDQIHHIFHWRKKNRKTYWLKNIKKNQIYYTFMEDDNTTISAVYTKVVLEWYDCILAIVWPLRVNYKKNVAILSQILQKLDQ